ncbi:hypothetical protein PSBY109024_14855 [Pseudoalteromonas byunsanensis]
MADVIIHLVVKLDFYTKTYKCFDCCSYGGFYCSCQIFNTTLNHY